MVMNGIETNQGSRYPAKDENLILNQFRRYIATLPALQMVETVGNFKTP
jgi:hypothetical protein